MSQTNTDVHIELHVPDFKKVIEFYGILEFEVVWIDERYLVMKKGDSYINFYEGSERVYRHSYFKDFPNDTKRGYAVEIVIPQDDIDTFYNLVKDKVKVVQSLKLKWWGKRDFRVEDPFGFYLRFTERYDWINDKEKISELREFLRKIGL